LVANGIVSATGYSPAQPFQISVFAMARETGLTATKTDVLVHHGSPDAPVVDVVETSVPAGTIVDNIAYPSFTSSYLELNTANYTLNVTPAAGSPVVASFSAPLATLAQQGKAITVLASGFLNPAVNINGPAFGLFVATSAGGPLIPLPPAVQTARVQVIHNSPDLAAATVDVYVNNVLLLDNFAFRQASPFVDAPAGVPISIQIKPSTSTVATPALFTATPTLATGSKYIVVADGIVSATGYSPNQPFQLAIFNQARETGLTPTKTDVLVHHGSPDAPAVDVVETSVPAGTIVDNIAYPSFTAGYLELNTANYTLNVTAAAGTPVVASYSAPLATLALQGKALTVLASGFLNPAVNSNGPSFGLYVALNTGGALIPLPTAVQTARVQVIHNSPDLAATTVDVYLNNTLLLDNFAFRQASPFVDAPAGVPISIQIKPSTSTVATPALFTATPTLATGSKYIVVADGIVSATGYSPNQPFQLAIFNQARETGLTPTKTDVLVHHGSPDAPAVDVIETSVPAGTIVDNIAYPSFTSNYLELNTANYTLNVTPAAGSPVVASYSAPLATLALQGKALTVLASGFLNPAVNSNGPAFGLFVALNTGGTLIPLPVNNLANDTFKTKNISFYPNPATSILNVEMENLDKNAKFTVTDFNGRTIMNAKLSENRIDVSALSNGMYFLNLEIDSKIYTQKFIKN
jgi:Domain of unknown function (DUF4397)/Secretion system C-terminal sorting domain